MLEGADETRALRGIGWSWDPDPNDTTFVTEYALVLREKGEVRVVHDRHVEGLFPIATWRHILTSVGFTVGTFGRPLDDASLDECFVVTKPAT